MTIFNEVFDQCYHSLAGTSQAIRDLYERKRYNRALLALRSQNYFLSCQFTNESGAAGVTGADRTLAIERELIIRGGGMNAIFIGGTGESFDVYDGGALNVKVTRSGSSRAQISKDTIRSSHYFSMGEAQKYALDWPIPWLLDRNEIIKVDFTQVSAVPIHTIFAIGFYGIAVDRELRCDQDLPNSIRAQVQATRIQKPRYIHLKTDAGGGTIVLPAVGTDERAVANTIEMPEHMLILGWRRFIVGMNTELGAAPSTTIRLVVTGGPAFSRIEIPVKAFEYYANMDHGYFKFMVPHFVPRGSSLSLSITSTIESIEQQYEGEIELLCVTV
jgi:hypothetical protein